MADVDRPAVRPTNRRIVRYRHASLHRADVIAFRYRYPRRKEGRRLESDREKKRLDSLAGLFPARDAAVICTFAVVLAVVFTARRLAKRGICRRRVSVCLSVCLCVCLSHFGIV